jgi:hypothetical protein
MPAFAYAPERAVELVTAIGERLRRVPAVTAVTYSDTPPLGIFRGTAFPFGERQAQASMRSVTPGYFAAMGMRIVDGRDFTDEDVSSRRPVFVVNRSFARQYLRAPVAGQSVRTFFREDTPSWQIIGVVEDVRHRGMSEPPEPEIYRYRDREDRRLGTAPTFIIRTTGDPAAFAPIFRSIVREQDPRLVVDSVMTMEERVLAGLERPRLYAVVLGGFALFAVVIAGVGLLGVLSYSVAQRSRELAVRTALGARRIDLARIVLGQAFAVTGGGVLVGMTVALFLTRTIASLLYGVERHDVVTLAAVPLALLLVAALASLAPALRAAKANPLKALRQG